MYSVSVNKLTLIVSLSCFCGGCSESAMKCLHHSFDLFVSAGDCDRANERGRIVAATNQNVGQPQSNLIFTFSH